jgi:hypothetical protein
MNQERKIFFVVASGGYDTERHYNDTIQRKRTIEEISQFLTSTEVQLLKNNFHGQPFAIWGAMPGSGNIRTWESMESGDYVMIYRNGKIILAAEIAMKVRNPNIGRYFWREESGKTWEYIYFLINDVSVSIDQSRLNKYLGYKDNYFPRGFTSIEQEKTNKLLSTYGDLISLLQKVEKGEKLEEIDLEGKKIFEETIEEKIEKAPTSHVEMQWRLIHLGKKSNLDVWVPKADQNIKYDGNLFKDFVIPEFQEVLDVPIYIKNIDTVWKLGFSIKAAFEIEHSTQIYSGILRLSDLRALAPNSNYPLFIVAERSQKNRVFDQLRRPTFSNDYLALDKAVKFLSYDKIREIDENIIKNNISGFDISSIIEKADSVPN